MSAFGNFGKPAGSSSLFGSLNLDTTVPSAATDPAAKRKSIFEPSSTTEARSSSANLFGASTSAATTAATTAPSFSFMNPNPTTASGGGGIFGSTTANTGLGTGTSAPSNTQPAAVNPSAPNIFPQAPAAQPSGVNQPFNASNFGLGASTTQAQPGPQDATQAANAPSTYFNGLLERQKKRVKFADAKSGGLGQLPSMNMDLNDLARRAQDLGNKNGKLGQSVGRDSRAHYILSGSGVTPGQAYKDFQRSDRNAPVTAAAAAKQEFADEGAAYLKGVQAKGREAMLRETMERVYQDVDRSIEESLGIDFDEQKRRIMQHFGLIAADSDEPAPTSSFGASKSKSGRRSIFGRSGLDKSLIGNASSMSTSAFGTSNQNLAPGLNKRQNIRDVRDKERNFMKKVEAMNIKRRDDETYKVFAEFKAVEQSVPGDVPVQVVDAYTALEEITKENVTMNGLRERSFVQSYAQDTNANLSIRLKKQFLNGARSFLEKAFYREVEDVVQKNPRLAQVGGQPTVVNKVRGYIRVRSSRHDLAPDGISLEQIGESDDYCWVIVFFLLRSGHVKEAVEHVNSDPAFQSVDRKFTTYISAYANAPDHILSRAMAERVNGEYQQRTKTAQKGSVDPYRIACLKIIGRCDVNQRSLESVGQGLEDWIWLQFALAREVDGLDDAVGEIFGLEQIVETVTEIGQKHFQKGSAEHANSYGTFFLMQILAGMFEQAIDYLHSYNPVSAVHAAIALDYHGLLRVCDYQTAGSDLCKSSLSMFCYVLTFLLVTFSTTSKPQINFVPLIAYYTASFRTALPVQAVDYLALICLNSDLSKPLGEIFTNACHEAMRELCLETREFAALLGDIHGDGSRIPGAIEKRSKIIQLNNHEKFLRFITAQAAAVADTRGQTADAVLLYHLCDDYDNVIAVLNRALADAVTVELGDEPMSLQPLKPRGNGSGSDTASQVSQANSSLSLTQSTSSPLELARNMTQLYASNAAFFGKINEQNRRTCDILMKMLSARAKVEHPTNPDYLTALEELNSISILPLSAQGDIPVIRQMATQFSSLPQLIARCAAFIVLWCIKAIGAQQEILKREGEWQAPGTSQEDANSLSGQLTQMARDLMVFAGLVKYKMPGRVYDLLTRAGADIGGY